MKRVIKRVNRVGKIRFPGKTKLEFSVERC